MANIINIKKKCAVCGKKSNQYEIVSYSSYGACDLDTRRQHNLDLICFGIQECPHCHYCNSDIESKGDKVDKNIVDSEEYKKLLNDKSIDSLARAYMLKALIADKEGKTIAAGDAYLTVAWRFDDLNQEENAKNARLNALAYLMRYYNQENNTIAALN